MMVSEKVTASDSLIRAMSFLQEASQHTNVQEVMINMECVELLLLHWSFSFKKKQNITNPLLTHHDLLIMLLSWTREVILSCVSVTD